MCLSTDLRKQNVLMLDVSIVVAFRLVFWQMHVIEQSVDAAYLIPGD